MQDGLKLNKNYKELYTTIKNLREYAKDNANDEFVRFSCYATYDSLVDILPSKEMIYDNNEMKLEELFNSICEREINAVYRNRKNYQVTVDTFYEKIYKIIAREMKSKQQEFLPIDISSKEQLEILKGYYQTTDKKLEKLFLEYTEKNRIFAMPSNDEEAFGTNFINPLSNESVVLINNKISSVNTMLAITHEFGHVLDNITFRDTHTSRETMKYFFTSPYSETNSTYQELAFLEYLIKNNIYQEEAIRTIKENIINLHLMPFTVMTSKKEKDESRLFEDYTNDDFIELANIKDEAVDLMTYGYGFMFAIAMLDDYNLYEKFQLLRTPRLDKKKLDREGFTDEVISKTMVKKIDEYYRRR